MLGGAMTQAEMGAAVPCVRCCGRCCTIAYPKIDAGLAIASIIEEELVGEDPTLVEYQRAV